MLESCGCGNVGMFEGIVWDAGGECLWECWIRIKEVIVECWREVFVGMLDPN